jgi:hypothetical protein
VAPADDTRPNPPIANGLDEGGDTMTSAGARMPARITGTFLDEITDDIPTHIRRLRYKVERAAEIGAEKLITFEFSHFMSPHSIYPAAHGLYRRYREWQGL